MSTIPIKPSKSTARKSTLKRTSTALTEALKTRGIMPFKSSSKSVKITKENKTIKFYKDNFRQILSLVILENNDNTLKNNLKEFYNDVQSSYNKLINFESDENLFDTNYILNRYPEMKKMVPIDLVEFLKKNYSINNKIVIRLNTNLIKDNDIEYFINSQINELNISFENLIYKLESLAPKRGRTMFFPFQQEGQYFNLLKNYISLRKKIKEYMFIINNVVTEKEGGILPAPIKEVGNLFLGSIGFYIIQTIKSEYLKIYEQSRENDNTNNSASVRIIVLVLKKLFSFVSNNIKINLGSYQSELNEIRRNKSYIFTYIEYFKKLNLHSNILLKLDSDWENSLLKIMALTLPNNIYIGNINQTDTKMSLKSTNTVVIDNGVNYHHNSSVKNFSPMCSGGNYVDGWSNTNCLNKIDTSIQKRQILSYDWGFDSGDAYSFKVKNTDVNIKINLNLGNKNLSLYTPKTQSREGLEEIKTNLKTDYLEAANVAIRAFQVLFEDEINHIVVEGQPNTIVGMFKKENRENFKRIEILLNTEFMDYDEQGNIIMKNGGRSLFNKFYGCFLGKTSGDTTQYLEANSNTYDPLKNIVKVDKDRPAFVGDCVFRALAKKHMNGPTKPRIKGSISGYLNNDNGVQYWCDDKNTQPRTNFDMLAWKMIVLVDTFHDYGFGNMGTRFKYIIDELAVFYKRGLTRNELYNTKTKTKKFTTKPRLSKTMKSTKRQRGGGLYNKQKSNELAQLFMSALIVYKINTFLESKSGVAINLDEYTTIDEKLLNKISILMINKPYKNLLILLNKYNVRKDFEIKIRKISDTFKSKLRLSYETGKKISDNLKDFYRYAFNTNISKELKDMVTSYKEKFTLENQQEELLERIYMNIKKPVSSNSGVSSRSRNSGLSQSLSPRNSIKSLNSRNSGVSQSSSPRKNSDVSQSSRSINSGVSSRSMNSGLSKSLSPRNSGVSSLSSGKK